MKFLHQSSNFLSYSQLGLLSRTGQFNKTNRVWMDFFVRATEMVAGGAQLVVTAAKMAALHTGGSRSCATETAPPPLGATLNAALPACSGGRSCRRAIRAVVVGRVAHCGGPPCRRTVRVVVVGRVAHRGGSSRRRTVRIVIVGCATHPVGRSGGRTICVVEIGRVAHPVGRPGRRTIRIVVVCRVARPIR